MISTGHRYNAACAAALAGIGPETANLQLDIEARACWRRKAIDWLQADLASWLRLFDTNPHQNRDTIEQTLRHWRVDPDLKGLRNPALTMNRSHAERIAIQSLWSNVDALLEKIANRKSP